MSVSFAYICKLLLDSSRVCDVTCVKGMDVSMVTQRELRVGGMGSCWRVVNSLNEVAACKLCLMDKVTPESTLFSHYY